MNSTIILAVTAFSLSTAFAVPATDADLNRYAKNLDAALTKLLKEDWAIRAEGSVVTLTSKFDTYSVIMISRSHGPPPFDGTASDKVLSKEAAPRPYKITLTFRKPLDNNEYQRRRGERQKHADILSFGASGKKEWSEAFAKYMTIQVPRYRKGFYDIYRGTGEAPGTRIYPPRAATKIGSALYIVDAILSAVHGATD